MLKPVIFLIRAIALALLAMLAAPHALADNLILDGSFETPVGCNVWCGNNDGAIRIQAPYFASPATGQTAPDGSFFEVLQSEAAAGPNGGPNATITQTVNGLTVGSQYTLTFDLLPWARFIPDPRGYEQSSTVNVIIAFSDGTQIIQAFSTPTVDFPDSVFGGAPYIYTTFYTENLTFTATDSSLSLSFQDPRAGEDSDGNNPGLDDVRLDVSEATATPEPGSILLLATGLVGAYSGMRRKAQAKEI